ncbi:hypothetical protein CLM85_07540 [Streptomyces albidoflavus]|nr:hypothetical protein CLM81_02205 [Streptomyces albidoflavus]PAX89173.1 hypothetical protein CLM82_22655 [Streptomyces albidoflavus]PBO18313.1 hypothetical protein CLM83_13075 [Streptomyces albidoflavus]PBO24895.1 hypothetical protein CLM85_07540 [Streptomyces albidoflavus]PBO27638.1 hypothetical protein CLM84_24680 [Streptomyces albidoflavus]
MVASSAGRCTTRFSPSVSARSSTSYANGSSLASGRTRRFTLERARITPAMASRSANAAPAVIVNSTAASAM